MRNNSSIAGNRFGRLIVKERVGTDKSGKNHMWRCECDCGGEVITGASNLRQNRTKSCGCLQTEVRGKASITHGRTVGGKRPAEYLAWLGARNRCFNSNNDSYSYYGGRGIAVCDRWLSSFENFLEDVGPRPSPDYSLDRIDVNGNYEPGNVRWATKQEQMANRRVHCLRCGTLLICQSCAKDK